MPQTGLTLLAGIFVVALPLTLICNNVRWVTLDPGTYREGFQKHGATQRTGIESGELTRIATAFTTYFLGPPSRLELTVPVRGNERALLSEREIEHMVDVQSLMRLVFNVGLWSGTYVLIFSAALLLLPRESGRATLGRLLMAGSGVSLLLLALVGGLSFVDFSELFIRFHELSFRNDLWMLDPRQDYLLMLFPESFWLDATLRIAALTAIESAALGGSGFLLARQRR